MHLLLPESNLTFYDFNSHLHGLVSCCRSGPHLANILVDVRYYHFRAPRWSSKNGISRLGTFTSHLQAKCRNPSQFFAMQFTRKQEAHGHMQRQMSENLFNSILNSFNFVRFCLFVLTISPFLYSLFNLSRMTFWSSKGTVNRFPIARAQIEEAIKTAFFTISITFANRPTSHLYFQQFFNTSLMKESWWAERGCLP